MLVKDIEFDPLDKFQHIPPAMLANMIGFLPEWAANANLEHLSLREAMELQYGFGPLHPFSADSTIDTQGIMRYPGDPDMYPLLRLTRGDEQMYIYQYGIVAFIGPDQSTFITRMD